jgi:glycosyltransferase involved in cell wall biosynthesis
VRIGIDGSCWTNRRGFGRFTRCLVTEMVRRDDRNSYVLLMDRPSLRDATVPPGVEVVEVGVGAAPARAASANGHRSVADIARMSAAARRIRAKVFFFPASYSYFPVFGSPIVVTMHDAIAERLPDLVFSSRRARMLWTAKQRAAARQARALVTVSEASRDALVSSLGITRDRIRVVREAPDETFRPVGPAERDGVLARHGIAPADRVILYVGGISPHKNLTTLVRAFELLADGRDDARLVLVGDLSDDPFLSAADTIRGRVDASPTRSRITLTGYVPDADLAALYSGAVATALPSLGEGFGLTAAESAACGTPVVASDDPALRELLGDAGLYADPRDPGAFAARLTELLDDPARRAEARAAVSRRAASWSWAQAADDVVDLLEQVGARRG